MGHGPGYEDVQHQPDASARGPNLADTEMLVAAREKAHNAADAAERAWHEYACKLEVGDARTRAFAVYENLRHARRL